jgi:hypothetical protein
VFIIVFILSVLSCYSQPNYVKVIGDTTLSGINKDCNCLSWFIIPHDTSTITQPFTEIDFTGYYGYTADSLIKDLNKKYIFIEESVGFQTKYNYKDDTIVLQYLYDNDYYLEVFICLHLAKAEFIRTEEDRIRQRKEIYESTEYCASVLKIHIQREYEHLKSLFQNEMDEELRLERLRHLEKSYEKKIRVIESQKENDNK